MTAVIPIAPPAVGRKSRPWAMWNESSRTSVDSMFGSIPVPADRDK